MACSCDEKKTLRVMQGTRGREIYITVSGLDWNLLSPPAGYTYAACLRVNGPSVGFSMPCVVVNETTVKFTLDAYEAGDTFYSPGVYGLALDIQKWTDPPGIDPEQQIRLDLDHCICLSEKVQCPAP